MASTSQTQRQRFEVAAGRGRACQRSSRFGLRLRRSPINRDQRRLVYLSTTGGGSRGPRSALDRVAAASLAGAISRSPVMSFAVRPASVAGTPALLALTIVVGVLVGLSRLVTVAIDWATRLFFVGSVRRRLFVARRGEPSRGATRRGSSGRARQWRAADGGRLSPAGGVIRPRALRRIVTVSCIGSGHSMVARARRRRLARAWRRDRPVGAVVPGRVKDLVPSGRGRCPGRGVQDACGRRAVCTRGNHRRHERGASAVDGRLGRLGGRRRSILGNEPAVSVPAITRRHPANALAYAVAGLVGGVVSLVFCKGLLGARSSRDCRPGHAVAARAGRSGDRRAPDRHSQVMGVGY